MTIKLVRIDVATGIKSAIVPGTTFGDEVARFTFNDGKASYVSVGAFPSKEKLVTNSTNPDHPINKIISLGRGEMEHDPVVVEANAANNWTPLWVDNTLRAV